MLLLDINDCAILVLIKLRVPLEEWRKIV